MLPATLTTPAIIAILMMAFATSTPLRAADDGTDQHEHPIDQPKPQKKSKATVKVAVAPHPSIHVGSLARINFRGRLMEEGDATEAQSGDQAELDIAKRRLGIEGDLLNKAIAFQVSREMGGDKTLAVAELPDLSDAPVGAVATPTTITTVSSRFTVDPWREAWIGYQQFDVAGVKYGLFKLPMSLDENTGAEDLNFAYRSLAASTLAPGRDDGWLVHGQVANHAFGYEYGVFEHDGHNAHVGATNPLRVTGGPTRAWRITSEPLRNVDSIWTDLEVGYAETRSTLAPGYSSIKGKTVAGFEFYNAKYLVNGDRKRSAFELRFRPGPFSLESEYIRITEERRGESVYNTDLAPVTAAGWYVAGTWAVTGEMKANGLGQPKHPLLRGGVGAVELAARIERITLGAVDATPTALDLASHSVRADIPALNGDRVVTGGVNWYPNRWLKLQLNLIREEITDPSVGPLPLQPSFWSKVIRFQIGF